MEEFEVQLQNFLKREELAYRVKALPNGSEVDWLIPHCTSIEDIQAFLISIGLKIKQMDNFTGFIIDDAEGNVLETIGSGQWVETSKGICVYVNDKEHRGFVEPSLETKKTSRAIKRSNFDVQLAKHLKKCEAKYYEEQQTS
jgi:hypothetical protein